MSSSRTPQGSGRTPGGDRRDRRHGGGRDEREQTGANTEPITNPRFPRAPAPAARTPGQGRDRGTPRGQFGDATPLYDE